MKRNTRTITVPATLDHLEALTGMVTEHLSAHMIPEKVAFEVDLAVDEACTNVIRYAYDPGGEGDVTVICSIDPHEVRVCIMDQGVPFNPLDVKPPDLTGDVEDRAIGGLGVHLIRTLMDRVSYHYRQGKNILCMTKGLPIHPKDEKSDNL
ncbi:MAG: serine-protein kinase RsbW [Methanoregulaceae archaeon PtaU1.Bin222]|nr:MAG: serine-protein kinase RsbW [Methanoregulaceae archaeon PtaU1.Bin222]